MIDNDEVVSELRRLRSAVEATIEQQDRRLAAVEQQLELIAALLVLFRSAGPVLMDQVVKEVRRIRQELAQAFPDGLA